MVDGLGFGFHEHGEAMTLSEFRAVFSGPLRAKLTEMLKYLSLLRTLAESGAPNPFFTD